MAKRILIAFDLLCGRLILHFLGNAPEGSSGAPPLMWQNNIDTCFGIHISSYNLLSAVFEKGTENRHVCSGCLPLQYNLLFTRYGE